MVGFKRSNPTPEVLGLILVLCESVCEQDARPPCRYNDLYPYSPVSHFGQKWQAAECINSGNSGTLRTLPALWAYRLTCDLLPRDLRGNAFECDCRAKWLMMWLKSTNSTVSDVMCAGPEAMKGKRLNDMTSLHNECISTGEAETKTQSPFCYC